MAHLPPPHPRIPRVLALLRSGSLALVPQPFWSKRAASGTLRAFDSSPAWLLPTFSPLAASTSATTAAGRRTRSATRPSRASGECRRRHLRVATQARPPSALAQTPPDTWAAHTRIGMQARTHRLRGYAPRRLRGDAPCCWPPRATLRAPCGATQQGPRAPAWVKARTMLLWRSLELATFLRASVRRMRARALRFSAARLERSEDRHFSASVAKIAVGARRRNEVIVTAL